MPLIKNNACISNCWKKSQLKEWQGVESELRDYESEISFNLPYPSEVIEKWIAEDSQLETEAPLDEDDIIEEVQKKYQKGDQSEERKMMRTMTQLRFHLLPAKMSKMPWRL